MFNIDRKQLIKYHLFATYLYAFFLPFGIYFSLKILILWAATALPFFNWTAIAQSKHKTLFFLLLLYVLIFFIGILYSQAKPEGFYLASKRLVIPAILLLMLPVSKFYKTKLDFILSLFVLGSILSAIILLFIAFYKSVYIYGGTIFFDPRTDVGISLKDSILNSKNFFTYREFSVGMHPGYRSMYYVFALATWIFLKRNPYSYSLSKLTKFLTRPVIFYPGFLLLSLIVFQLSSKTNLISLFLLYLLIFLTSKFPHRYLITLIFGILGIIFIIKNPRTTRLINALHDYNKQTTTEKDSLSLARLYFWKSSIEIGAQHPIFGVGTSDLEWLLMKANAKRGLYSFVSPAYNAHNEFIDTFARLGFIGLVLLLAWLGYLFYIGVKERRQLLLFLLILLMINASFEVIFNRQVGIVFSMFFIGILLFNDVGKGFPQIFF